MKIRNLFLLALLLASMAVIPATAQDTLSLFEIDVMGTAVITSSSGVPSNAFDGDLDTPWQPLSDPKGMWLKMDFAKPVTFNAAKIYEHVNYNKNHNVISVQLQYSDDGENWRSAFSGETIGERLNIDFDAVTAKYVRLDMMGRDAESPKIGEIKLIYKSKESAGASATYYVSTSGDDKNGGTKEKPFRTIQRAADRMKAGDICLVREGTYRESVVPKNSGEKGKPIKFVAYPGEKVTISGADLLEGDWKIHDGQIYKMRYDQKVTQLFVDGKMYNIARWPNAKVNNLHEHVWARSTWNTNESSPKTDNLQEPAQYAKADSADYGFVMHADIPNGDWDGAMLHIWSGLAWNAFEREVTQKVPKQLDFVVPFPPRSSSIDHDLGDIWKPKKGNKFYVYGVLVALDIPTEWLQDKKDNSIYVWTESGDPTGQLIERKARDWAFDLVDKSYITVEGFDIFASSVRVRASDNCLVDKCFILYPGDDIKKPVIISGSDNAITNSLIAHSPGDGVLLYGNNNLVDNCIIHDVNTFGDHHAAVQTSGVGNRITHNTMYNAGRSIILHYYSRKLRIEYNILRNGGTLGMDLGATYTYGNNNNEGSQGSVIAYNWVFDMGENTGIYLDSYSMGYFIHHNIVGGTHHAMVVNSGGLNNMIYNNTFLNETVALFSIPHVGVEHTLKGTRFINNIWKGKTMFPEGENAPEVVNNTSALVDSNFVPLEGSAAVDKGLELPGFTDGFAGKAPDIGAYELGGEYWKPGANWKSNE